MEQGFIALDGVSHRYGADLAGHDSVTAVADLTLSVNRGEFAAVVGPSGCGKSTLMKLVTGLQFPYAGNVAVAGAQVKEPVKIAGMAFQAPTLLPWRTTLENLLLPLEIVQPHRSQMRRKKSEYVARAEACSPRSACTAPQTGSPGNCPAACSSAPRSAARSSMSRNS